MKFFLGLTGSIGMGKSTTAGFFKDAGCDVWHADIAVHQLYSKQGAAVAPLSKLIPKALIEGEISRQVLKYELANAPNLIKKLEEIVHPLVEQDRQNFIKTAQSSILVFDVPMLFETGKDVYMNATVCVTVNNTEQEKRVLKRGFMDKKMFKQLDSRQWPNSQKCKKADFVIVTDTIDHAREQVDKLLKKLKMFINA